MTQLDLSQFNETDRNVIEELTNQCGRSFEQIAEACGITARQLRRIREKPAVKAAIKKVSDDVSSEIVTLAMPDITRAMVKKAEKGDVKAAQLLFQFQGLLIDRKEINATTTHIAPSNYEDMSNDDINARMAEIQRQLATNPKRIEVGEGANKEYGYN